MASIRKELVVDARPEHVWAAIRDVGAVDRLFPGVLAGARLDGGARVVTFAQGMVVRELIVDVDDQARRLVYAAVGGRTTHHNASLQVFTEGERRTRIVWITDLLPHELAGPIGALVEQGAAAMQRALFCERTRSWPGCSSSFTACPCRWRGARCGAAYRGAARGRVEGVERS